MVCKLLQLSADTSPTIAGNAQDCFFISNAQWFGGELELKVLERNANSENVTISEANLKHPALLTILNVLRNS